MILGDTKNCVDRARVSLEGLAAGDAFGETFFWRPAQQAEDEDSLADGPWHWTDDTEMALSVYQVLEKRGFIDQDELAGCFAARYTTDPRRGYGASMHGLLRRISGGAEWRTLTYQQFAGQGSWGNGSAMRIAPLGAYFAHDLAAVAGQAALSAEVTHAHPEGAAGAIAVALAAAHAVRIRESADCPSPEDLLMLIADATPDSLTRDGIRRAALLPSQCSVRLAAEALGCGLALSCQDTVPFALWCAARHLTDYQAALRLCASGGGDMDTTCAMAGGIVVLSAGRESIPPEWLARCDSLPEWVYVPYE